MCPKHSNSTEFPSSNPFSAPTVGMYEMGMVRCQLRPFEAALTPLIIALQVSNPTQPCQFLPKAIGRRADLLGGAPLLI